MLAAPDRWGCCTCLLYGRPVRPGMAGAADYEIGTFQSAMVRAVSRRRLTRYTGRQRTGLEGDEPQPELHPAGQPLDVSPARPLDALMCVRCRAGQLTSRRSHPEGSLGRPIGVSRPRHCSKRDVSSRAVMSSIRPCGGRGVAFVRRPKLGRGRSTLADSSRNLRAWLGDTGRERPSAVEKHAVRSGTLTFRARLNTQAARGWAAAGWRARRRVITMIIAQ